MGTWRVTSDEDDPRQLASEHEYYVVGLTGPLDVDEPAERGVWDADSARLVTGWRAGCECGWRGPVLRRALERVDARLFSPDGWHTFYVEGFCAALAEAHVDQVLATA